MHSRSRQARSWILLILDSCRYDSMIRAQPRELMGLGSLERRYAYATWTGPAHHHLLNGVLPHRGEAYRTAAQVYRENFLAFEQRLGVPLDWPSLAPDFWLPSFLRRQGWHTGAWVSLPVLHPATTLSRDFDFYQLRQTSSDFAGIIDDLRFYIEKPSFWLINTGETHYPYYRPDQPSLKSPRVSGVHGTLQRLHEPDESVVFTSEQLSALHERQVDAVRYIDSLIPKLRAIAPPNTWLTVTADHGECFGEDGFFGHGPVIHPKVLEVPFVEGLLTPTL